MKLYIKVSDDKYRLIEAVGDTPAELGRLVGATANAISSGITHAKTGGPSSRYELVELEDDEEILKERKLNKKHRKRRDKYGKEKTDMATVSSC